MMLRCCLGGVDGKHDSCQNERRSFKECLNKNVFFFGLRKKRDKVDVKSVKISIYTPGIDIFFAKTENDKC